ncbi:protein of unknown function [Stenotrophomonas maltophilia]|nr:protein of unknown function [Stenotrophomonas maltophilia]
MGLSLSFREKKVTKETLRHPRAGAARRCPVLLGESGDGAELAALKQRRLFAPDSPAVLGSLQGGLNSRERTHDRSCRPEPSVGSALHRPRTQETVESLRVGPGGTVRGMDAAAELTGMYLQRVLPGPTRRLHPIPGRRCSTQPTRTQQKTRPRPGFSHDHTTSRNQSPCCFCRCSQRS